MTIGEAIEYINAHTWSQWKLGLSRTRELLARMGNPQRKLRFVHVAGSNGKGSTCAMIERILREAGYTTGFYPSPYIEDFRERIQVSGEYITEEALCRITGQVREQADAMEDHPTQFELITAIGMVYFAEKMCDIVVLEVGLGGTFDSTNVIDVPEVAVITNIGLEHTEYLGNTLAEIAGNKCGIIKPGSDVVCYDNVPEVMEVVRRACEEKGCPLTISGFGRVRPLSQSLEGQTFRFLPDTESVDPDMTGNKEREESEKPAPVYRLSLLGEYQLHNAAAALTTVEVLQKRDFWIPAEAIRRGLEKVCWPARFEVLSRSPLFILDGGHNPQCAAALAESLRTYLPEQKIVFLMGMLADKDYRTVIDTISPFAASFVCLTPDSPRALPAAELALELKKRGFEAKPCVEAAEAVRTALKMAGEAHAGCPAAGQVPEMTEDVSADCGEKPLPVVAFGSLYMAGAIRAAFRKMYGIRHPDEDILEEKQRQRRLAMRRRRELTEKERAEKSALICSSLRTIPELQRARTVFSYASSWDEVNLDEINRELEAQGKTVCYPLTQKDGIMHAVFSKRWRIGAFGIREPVREQAVPVDPAEIDVVLVPCVAFDRQGGRCGHGAGYYDRFLGKLSGRECKILVAFDAQEIESIVTEETDVGMDMAVTESGILSF